MTYRNEFKTNDAQTREEKLIIELATYLHEATKNYANINKENCTGQEMFLTLRDGSLAFIGQHIEYLAHTLMNKSQKPVFVKDCENIFHNYIEQIFMKIKNKKI